MKTIMSVIREPKKNKQLNQVAGEKEEKMCTLKEAMMDHWKVPSSSSFRDSRTEKSQTWITWVTHYYIYLSILPFDTLVKLSVCIVSAFRFFLFGHQVTDMRRNLYLFTKCLSEDYSA